MWASYVWNVENIPRLLNAVLQLNIRVGHHSHVLGIKPRHDVFFAVECMPRWGKHPSFAPVNLSVSCHIQSTFSVRLYVVVLNRHQVVGHAGTVFVCLMLNLEFPNCGFILKV
jgi:hypothetical protein